MHQTIFVSIVWIAQARYITGFGAAPYSNENESKQLMTSFRQPDEFTTLISSLRGVLCPDMLYQRYRSLPWKKYGDLPTGAKQLLSQVMSTRTVLD